MTSEVNPSPGTPLPRAEDCERLSTGQLRAWVVAGARSHQLSDGTELELSWEPVRGCFGGRGGRALVITCPRCSRPCRVLWHAPLSGWGCRRCNPVSYRSHRRSGSGRGRCKPASWHLDRIEAEQRRVAALLGLRWPVQRLLWRLDDLRYAPRVSGAPRLSRRRREALIHRLDALENLRFRRVLPLLSCDLKALGCSPPDGHQLDALATSAEERLTATAWAVRRPATDPRTTRCSGSAPLRDVPAPIPCLCIDVSASMAPTSSQNMTALMSMRITQEERDWYHAIARSQGLTLSDLVRKCLWAEGIRSGIRAPRSVVGV